MSLADQKLLEPSRLNAWKELIELQTVWDKFTQIAPEIAKRSNDSARMTSLKSAKATPDGRLVLLDWE